MPRYKLIVFDFDDTLIHLDVDWSGVKNDILKIASRQRIFADKTKHLIVLGNMISKSSAIKNEVDGVYRKREKEAVDRKGYLPLPHMIALVKELHQNGYRLAIASGNHSSNLRAVLARLGILPLFDVVCGRDMIWNNKPASDQLLFVMQRTGFDKSETLFIGDSKYDEESAESAGVGFFLTEKPASESDAGKLRGMLLGEPPGKPDSTPDIKPNKIPEDP